MLFKNGERVRVPCRALKGVLPLAVLSRSAHEPASADWLLWRKHTTTTNQRSQVHDWIYCNILDSLSTLLLIKNELYMNCVDTAFDTLQYVAKPF